VKNTADRNAVFRQTYSDHSWGGVSHSGPGSDERNVRAYVRYVQRWLDSHSDIKNVVEIGCGDWGTTRFLDLKDRFYTGIDIVPEAINHNKEKYGSPSVVFKHLDFVESHHEIPNGDVIIAKDVLQHLSNSAVALFCKEVMPRYRFAILTNDWLNICWRRSRLHFQRPFIYQRVNAEISDGEYRPLHLGKPPFSLPSMKTRFYLATIHSGTIPSIYIKQILIWKREKQIIAGC